MSAAPAMGASPPGAPGSADQEDDGTYDDLNIAGQELDISKKHMQKALKYTPIISFPPIHRKGHNVGSGPQVIFPDKVNASGSVDGRLMQGNMQKLRNPNGSRADGPEIEPIHLRPTKRKDSLTYSKIWLTPFKQQQGGAGMGMGGMPPGGGGLPPPPGGI